MEISYLSVGQLATNCYLVSEEDSCVIIDPGADADYITTSILEKKLKPKAILLTHAHFDHCLACLELKLNFDLPIYLHSLDLPLYRKAIRSADHWTGESSLLLPNPDFNLEDQQTLKFDNLVFQVISTPGHTPGSVCFATDHSLFTGDTLFAHGIGRTDFSYSNEKDLKKSLKKINRLPGETLIYPGHEDFAIPLSEALFHLS